MRAKGEGTIRKRPDGRYEARLAVDGRRLSFFAKTQREALQKLRQGQSRQDQHLPTVPAKLTVAEYLASWVEGKKISLRPESWRRYDARIRLHIEPRIGAIRLVKLEPGHLRGLYAELLTVVSATTVQHIHGLLHLALQDALREDLVARNVAALVKAPKRDTPEMRALRPDEVRQLLDAAKGERLEAFFTMAITTGLRLGELQALAWTDIDFDRQRLTVRRTLAQDGRAVFSPSSSRKNHLRQVWLSEVVIQGLERHRATQEAERQAAGTAWTEHNLVFTNAVGGPLDGRNLRRRSFPVLLAKAGLPRFRIHDLRHTAATLLLTEGVPVKVVAELLGHADVSTTLRIYAHVLEGAQAQAVSAMDRILHG